MLTPQFNSVSIFFTLARPNFALSTLATAVLSTVSCGETTMEMTNRIYDRYFGPAAPVDSASAEFE